MTSRQQSKLKTYLVVKEYLTTNSAIVSALPNYSVYLAIFLDSIEQIQSLETLLLYDKSGIKVHKDKLKLALAMLGIDTSRKIKAYARFAKNDVLLAKTDYNESDLKSASDTSLVNIVQGIYDLAQSNSEALTSYGITAATQTALLKALTDFSAVLPKPRTDATENIKLSTQLENTFQSADSALEEIKVLCDTIKMTQPVFWNGLQSASKVIELGAGSLAVTGVISDQDNNEGIKGATITFVPETRTSKGRKSDVIIKRSAKKGGFRLKKILPGTYTVTVKKTGYNDYVKVIVIAEGELTRLFVALAKK